MRLSELGPHYDSSNEGVIPAGQKRRMRAKPDRSFAALMGASLALPGVRGGAIMKV